MLNKIKIKLISLGVIVSLIAVIIACQSIYLSQEEKLCSYDLEVSVERNYLSGKMNFQYVNNTENLVNELFFCLYPNAFKSDENIKNVAVSDRVNEAYPNGFDEGFIEIKKVLVNNRITEFYLEEQEQILKIPTHEIPAGKEATVHIEFYEKLPNSPMRYGYGNYTFNFGNWYPILCPTVDGKVVKSTYIANGDPFCSQVADYFVKITAPSEMRLASSGEISKQKNSNPLTTTWEVKGEKIRDFAFVLSDKLKLQSKQVGKTIIYSYYLEDDQLGKFALEKAENALKCFNEKFGEYPYSTLSVVASDFYIGGMEYPNLVLINKDLYMPVKEEALEEVVVHEVAHQWWYGLVGNDEIKEPWLDEGLTQFSVGVYYDDVYGKERYKMFMQENEGYCKVIFKVLENLNLKFNRKIERSGNEFEHWLLYDAITYDVTALMLDALKTTVGEKAFYAGLQQYFEENKYKIATKKDFVSSLTKGTGKNIASVLEPWLSGTIYWG